MRERDSVELSAPTIPDPDPTLAKFFLRWARQALIYSKGTGCIAKAACAEHRTSRKHIYIYCVGLLYVLAVHFLPWLLLLCVA